MGKGTRAAGQRTRAASTGPSSSGPTSPPPTRRADAPRPGKPKKSGHGATFSVLMMTIASLAAVGVLAAQAEATAPRVRAPITAVAAKSGSKSGSGSTTTTTTTTFPLPASSGSGTRIVYSVGQKRAWLVQDTTVDRTMEVVPGTIAAPAGTYEVSAKSPGATGSDGVQVLYVVRFDSSSSSTTYGFDADANVSGLPPAPTGQTAGIRMAQTDAYALYQFSSVGTSVVVVP